MGTTTHKTFQMAQEQLNKEFNMEKEKIDKIDE